jgi:hypothetical protein
MQLFSSSIYKTSALFFIQTGIAVNLLELNIIFVVNFSKIAFGI